MAYNNSALATIQTRPVFVIQDETCIFSTDLFTRFIDYTDRKDTTIKGYVSCIRQFARWMADNSVVQPQREDIKAYRDHLTSSGLATGTQSQYLRAVKHFFKWTAAEGLYPNVADNIHGAKVRHDVHRKDAFTRGAFLEIANTIERDTTAGKRLYAMFLLVFVDGLRTVELHRANVGDIKTVGGDMLLYIQGKGHDEKDAPKSIPPQTAEAIKDYLQSREDKPTAKSPLFVSTSNKGKPGAKLYKKDENGNKVLDRISDGRIATTSISTMFKECFVKAGYDSDRLTAHSGRHTAATTAISVGASIHETQQLMGHCDPATTEIYVHTTDLINIEKKYRQRIEDYYFNGVELNPVLPELEAAIMALTPDEQRQLLAQIRAQKGEKTA